MKRGPVCCSFMLLWIPSVQLHLFDEFLLYSFVNNTSKTYQLKTANIHGLAVSMGPESGRGWGVVLLWVKVSHVSSAKVSVRRGVTWALPDLADLSADSCGCWQEAQLPSHVALPQGCSWHGFPQRKGPRTQKALTQGKSCRFLLP